MGTSYDGHNHAIEQAIIHCTQYIGYSRATDSRGQLAVKKANMQDRAHERRHRPVLFQGMRACWRAWMGNRAECWRRNLENEAKSSELFDTLERDLHIYAGVHT